MVASAEMLELSIVFDLKRSRLCSVTRHESLTKFMGALLVPFPTVRIVITNKSPSTLLALHCCFINAWPCAGRFLWTIRLNVNLEYGQSGSPSRRRLYCCWLSWNIGALFNRVHGASFLPVHQGGSIIDS